MYFSEPPPWIVETDGESKYVELFNNSDRVIHLDGMLLGHVYHWHYEVPMFEHHYCRDTEPLRNDPEGVWVSAIWRFPGSGVDYPVSPGEVVLIAVLAGDHRGRHESFLDLSHADFEFLLPGFADNPAVTNMQVVGTRPQRVQDFVGDALLVVAEPQNVTGYPRVSDPGAANYIEEYVRIPTATIHDLSYLMWDRYGSYSTLPPFPFCDEPVHPRFDRIPGGFRTSQDDTYRSMQRRVSNPGVLLDTNVSRIDFVMGLRTPGTIQ